MNLLKERCKLTKIIEIIIQEGIVSQKNENKESAKEKEAVFWRKVYIAE